MFKRLFNRAKYTQQNKDGRQSFILPRAEALYQQAVEASREPNLYIMFNINDTPLGRFELLSIHLFLLLRCLKDRGDAISCELSQELTNLFVADMDHSLRDIRIGESKADKQFKKFVEGFYGRLVSYDQAIDCKDNTLVHSKMIEVLLKNVYDGTVENSNSAALLTDYMLYQLLALQQQNNMTFERYHHDKPRDTPGYCARI